MKIPVNPLFHSMPLCSTCPNLERRNGSFECTSELNDGYEPFKRLSHNSCYWYREEFGYSPLEELYL